MISLDPPEEWDEAEWDEGEWMEAAAKNPTFSFLEDEGEDIYTVSDGKPISPS